MVIRKKYDLMFQDIMLDSHFNQVGRSRKENIDMSNNDLNMVKAGQQVFKTYLFR
jgi:hypothetical protein